jgi:predicted PurR-regulated permease PerM
MKKKLIAFSAAVLITACVGLAMLVIGGAALLNKNGTVAANTNNQVKTADITAQQDAQIQQMQALIDQYQQREKEYQQREQQYQEQLSQLNTQIQQFQQLLMALQQRGLIMITGDGRILIR